MTQLSGLPSPSQRYVCVACITEPVLLNDMHRVGRLRRCTYCRTRGRAVSLEALASEVDDVYRTIVRRAESVPVGDPDSDRVHWSSDGSTPSELITVMIECDTDNIAHDIVRLLADKHAYGVAHDGDDDVFDDTSDDFEIEIPQYHEFRETWASFCRSITHENRFFNKDAASMVAEILEPILRGEWPKNESAVVILEPPDAGRFYRGRLANDVVSRAEILSSPRRHLGAPPPHLNAAGRMNAAGIGAFYGSFDAATCVAELRAPVGGNVIVGAFEILRPLRVLDLTILDRSAFRLSYFEEDFARQYAYNRFLRGFHSELKKPVIPGRETLAYLPTQFVCEYLWASVTPRFGGLIYGSSQLSGDGRNIVLFPHALVVEHAAAETPGVPAENRDRSLSDEDEDEIVWMREFPSVDERVRAPWGANPSLRLLTDEIVVRNVRGINYEFGERRISVHREADPRGEFDF